MLCFSVDSLAGLSPLHYQRPRHFQGTTERFRRETLRTSHRDKRIQCSPEVARIGDARRWGVVYIDSHGGLREKALRSRETAQLGFLPALPPGGARRGGLHGRLSVGGD